jgi:tRNA A-37 threonylcarbamoyl transferase component Bud32
LTVRGTGAHDQDGSEVILGATRSTVAERALLRSSTLAVGVVIAERYRVQAVLGEGGMGVVYRVEHTHLRKLYALKVLRPEWTSTREVVARFEREAVAAGRIQSPHVVAATDFGRLADGSFFLVMEYVNGRTLRSVLASGSGALEPVRALRIVRGLVAALGAAHSLGIVHRDVKPENVMLVEHDGEPDFVKVLDFGVAKAGGLGGDDPAGGSALTKAGAIMGTLAYMAPEQALGQHVDARSDLYSAGVILFEMLTGQCPFQGGANTMWRQHVVGDVPELPVEAAARIDARLGAVLRRMLATAPENRFENATALAVALEDCASDAPRPAPPSPSRPSLESVRGKATAAAVAVRVRQSLLEGVQVVRGAVRRMTADGGALSRHAIRVREAARQAGRWARAGIQALIRLVIRAWKASSEAARRAYADREALLRRVRRPRLVVLLVVFAVVSTVAVALLFGGQESRESHAAKRTSDPIPVVAPASHSPAPYEVTGGAEVVPLVNLPPPPSPSSAPPPPGQWSQ